MNKKFTKLIKRKLNTRKHAMQIVAFSLTTTLAVSASAGVIPGGLPAATTANEVKHTIADMVIRGIVKDEKGLPIPGASVKVKGSLAVTVTDINGSFSINVPSESAVLVVTFIGYDAKEVPVGSQKTILIQLSPNSKALEEVAIVGFGTQRKVS